jgi:hypothetical protein
MNCVVSYKIPPSLPFEKGGIKAGSRAVIYFVADVILPIPTLTLPLKGRGLVL